MGSLPPTPWGVNQRPGQLELVNHSKDFRFYPDTEGQPSEGFKPVSDGIPFVLKPSLGRNRRGLELTPELSWEVAGGSGARADGGSDQAVGRRGGIRTR